MPTLLFQFKQLMLSIDPDDDNIPPPHSQSIHGHGTPAAAGTPSGGQAGVQWMQHKVALKLSNHKSQNQLLLLISPGMAMEIMVVKR